jgi:hypothetical protein
MPVPTAVRNATYAVYAIVALVVLRVILTVTLKDDLVDEWIESNSTARAMPREQALELLTAPAYVPIAIGALVIASLLAVAAVNLPKGASWARIVAIVFAALQIVGLALTFLAPSLLILHVVNALVALLSIAVIMLLAGSHAKQFFASSKTAAV